MTSCFSPRGAATAGGWTGFDWCRRTVCSGWRRDRVASEFAARYTLCPELPSFGGKVQRYLDMWEVEGEVRRLKIHPRLKRFSDFCQQRPLGQHPSR